MKFLSNNPKENHQSTIIENLKLYDEAFIAVAFLKVSGLNLLIADITKFLTGGGQLSIIAGQNFALTEPEALHTLRKLFKQFPKSKLYLSNANEPNIIFHPKLYLFKCKNDCCIISGSANITKGGLQTNKETSLIADCLDTQKLWIDAKDYFEKLTATENSTEATLLTIKQYESFYENQKLHNKKSKAIPTKTKSQLEFNYSNLLKHFLKFDISQREEEFRDKLNNYKEAKIVLDKIADRPNLTQKQFADLLDSLVGSKEYYSWWKSGSLYRLRRKVYPYFKEFRELVRYIRENKSKSPEIIFDKASELIKKIEGAGVNYITEIMMTYNSNDFANMNKNPITVLRQEGGVNINASTASFDGIKYAEYCEIIKEINTKLGLKNMLEADSFFNEIYWDIK